jgi:uncharacterized Zn-binding protein involved in type VI secretion
MFPAARITDPITHDNIVPSGVISPPGVPTVLIEFLPAAVMGDQVACTGVISVGLVHPPAPPLPTPPIILGSPTVLIGGRPAARWVVSVTACGAFLGLLPLMATRTVFIGDIGGAGGGGGAAGAGPGGPPAQVINAYKKGTSTSVGPVPPEHTGPLQPEEDEKKKTWIGVILKDFKGQPMPNQDFQITLDKGQVLKGRTDEKGYARFDKLDPDSGNVVFTELTDIKDQEKAPGGPGQQPTGAQLMDYDSKPLPESEAKKPVTDKIPENLFDEDILFDEEDEA